MDGESELTDALPFVLSEDWQYVFMEIDNLFFLEGWGGGENRVSELTLGKPLYIATAGVFINTWQTTTYSKSGCAN